MEDDLVEHRTRDAKPVSQPDAPTTRPTPCAQAGKFTCCAVGKTLTAIPHLGVIDT